MREYQKHIAHPRAGIFRKAICGADIGPMDWHFEDIGHAFTSVAGGYRMQPCPKCAAEIIRVFQGEG